MSGSDYDDVEKELKQITKDMTREHIGIVTKDRLYLRLAILAVSVLNSIARALWAMWREQ